MTIGISNWEKLESAAPRGGAQFLRLDSDAGQTAADVFRMKRNAQIFGKMYEEAKATLPTHVTQRLDSVGSGAGIHLARQLEHVYAEVLKEKYSPTNALDLFEVDSSVPAGARTHTVRRIKHNGEARFYEGNSSRRPTASVEQREKTFNLAPVITSIRISFFDQLAADFSGFALRTELEDAARDVMDRFLNDKILNGAPSRGLPGVLNYPWVPKFVSAVVPNSDTEEAVLVDLHAKANFAAERSKGLYSPSRMLLSIRMHNYLSTTKRSATTEDTILSAFLKDNPYISEAIPVHELAGVGPSGEDAVIFDRKDRMAFSRVMAREFTMLPAQDQGMDIEIPCYSIFGGMISREPLHNTIAYYDASSLPSY